MKEIQFNEQRLQTTPQIKNINQDPNLSGMFKFALNEGDNFIGKKTSTFEPAIALSGAGIAMQHALINYNSDERTVTLVPNQNDPVSYQIKVNGERKEEPCILQHGDRILVGSHAYYQYMDPKISKLDIIDWESAMKEANKDQMAQFGFEGEEDSTLKEMREKAIQQNNQRQKELEEAKRELQKQKALQMKEM